jgi:hypothetical protein
MLMIAVNIPGCRHKHLSYFFIPAGRPSETADVGA